MGVGGAQKRLLKTLIPPHTLRSTSRDISYLILTAKTRSPCHVFPKELGSTDLVLILWPPTLKPALVTESRVTPAPAGGPHPAGWPRGRTD